MERNIDMAAKTASPQIEDQAATCGTATAPAKWPQYEADEIAAILSILQSGRVNSLVHGGENKAFEREFAEFCGVPHAIAVANGTVALELALRALNIGPGDEVIVPARSFFASVSCIIAVGATPVFADILLDSQAINPRSVKPLISNRTKAVICVHLAGWPCDMDELVKICGDHDIHLIEDCAQAHGATYNGQKVGSFGAAAAFSFCTDKIMSTGGEGGMIVMQDEGVWERAWAYKDHGKNPKILATPSNITGFRYVHDSFGSNFRLTEMQAAIGRRQLAKLPGWITQRRANIAILRRELAGIPALILPDVPDIIGHVYYKFYARINLDFVPDDFNLGHFLRKLINQGVPIGSGSCPDMSREKAFGGILPKGAGHLENAAILERSTIMLPCDHLISADEMADMGKKVAAASRQLSL